MFLQVKLIERDWDLGLPEQLPKSPHSPGVLRAFVTIANENVLQVLHR
jgi:hypothetical protein